jgi:predicted DNA-binding WGR domain protein
MISHFERHRADKNSFRFYRTELTPDLFGDWVLTCIWGRIGSCGRARRESFGSQDQAETAQARLLTQRRRKGYVLLPEQLDLPFDLFTAP